MTALTAFAGTTALVTGAGDGIGAMLARKLAASGMRVCVQDIRLEAAEAVAAELGDGAFALQADVSDRDSLAVAAESLRERGTVLNLLWLNAGVGAGSPVLEGNPRTIEWAFGVNVLGVIWSMQAFWPLQKAATGPRHVGITASSASTVAPAGDFPLYALTKHGTFAVAEALRAELAEQQIDTTVLCPGLLNTNIWDGARARPERFGGVRRMDPAIAQTWREAQDPAVMWPDIEASIAGGGGYLVCATEPALEARFDARQAEIKAGFRALFEE